MKWPEEPIVVGLEQSPAKHQVPLREDEGLLRAVSEPMTWLDRKTDMWRSKDEVDDHGGGVDKQRFDCRREVMVGMWTVAKSGRPGTQRQANRPMSALPPGAAATWVAADFCFELVKISVWDSRMSLVSWVISMEVRRRQSGRRLASW